MNVYVSKSIQQRVESCRDLVLSRDLRLKASQSADRGVTLLVCYVYHSDCLTDFIPSNIYFTLQM